MLALSSIAIAAEPVEPWLARHALPEEELEPFNPAQLHDWFHGGEPEADECEHVLAWAARARGGIDLGIAEGLNALRQGDRLPALGFRLQDYAREVLGLGKRAAESLARLGDELTTRPRLREAVRTGRVVLRAAQTVLPVAKGDQEPLWVERAARRTVRELEEAVRRTGAAEEDDDEWVRLSAQLPDHERQALDVALEVAGVVLPGSMRAERLEAIAQEFLGEFSNEERVDDARPLDAAFRAAPRADEAARRAELEQEQDRWSHLPPTRAWPAPEVTFDRSLSAQEVDGQLRALAAARSRWDDLIGHHAYAVRRSGMYRRLGFASFRHYVEERLGLPGRAVEQRAAFEEKLSTSAALREARRQGVSYERLRLLATLPEGEIRWWIPRAKALTCVALRRKLEGERERQMRARRTLAIPLTRRVAAVLAAAVAAVRERFGRLLPMGTCLAALSGYFVKHWRWVLKRCQTRSEKVRERDLGFCQAPGCSARATHAHHVKYRSRGGGDEPSNLVGVCAFHHLRCIHGGYLQVTGEAPDGLTWWLGGVRFTGGVMPGLSSVSA